MVLKSINCLIADGTTVKIDFTFYKEFKKYNWYCDNSTGYIVTFIKVNGKRTLLSLHHYVLNFKYDPNVDLVADHKYGNKRDCRSKKLRLVSHSINALNQRRDNNTGFPNIYCSCYKNNYYYQVSFLNVDKVCDSRIFRYIEGINEVEVFQKAFDFFEDIKKTLPHYIEAFPNPDDDSSSDESIEEINLEDKINIDRLRPDNTSKLKNINDCGTYWQVRYYDKNGNRQIKPFPYFPKSSYTKDDSLKKALVFQKKKEKYHPKKKEKTIVNINVVYETKKKKKKYPILKSKINIEDNDDFNSNECSNSL